MVCESDYPMLCDWWGRHKWPAVPYNALPQFGMIAHTEISICAGWLYVIATNGGTLCWIEWLVTNPDAPLKDRHSGLNCLLDRLKSEAKLFGALFVFVTLKHKSLVRLYAKHGFKVGDKNMTNMVLTWQ